MLPCGFERAVDRAVILVNMRLTELGFSSMGKSCDSLPWKSCDSLHAAQEGQWDRRRGCVSTVDNVMVGLDNCG